MKLYYRNDTGEIIYAVRDADAGTFVDSCNVPHATMSVDEIADNAALCQDLAQSQGRGKYVMAAGKLTLAPSTPVAVAVNADLAALAAAAAQDLTDLAALVAAGGTGPVPANTAKLAAIVQRMLKRLVQL